MIFEKSSPSLGDSSYVLFVSFLYAWVTAGIAERFVAACKSTKLQLPVWSHLTLAAVVVATSWLGWSNALGRGLPPSDVIAAPSLLLIVDFWILGVYFAFVAIVNGTRLVDRYDSMAAQPVYWLALILLGYSAWDVIWYWTIPRWTKTGDGSNFWPRSWMSFGCFVVTLLFFPLLRRVKPGRWIWVVTGDLSLMALLLFYRGLKQLAGAAAGGPLAQIEALIEHPFENWLNTFTLVCFLVSFLLATLPWKRRQQAAPPPTNPHSEGKAAKAH